MNELKIVCTHGAAADADVKGRTIARVLLLTGGRATGRGSWPIPGGDTSVADLRWERSWQRVTDIEDERYAGHVRVDDEDGTWTPSHFAQTYRAVYECPAPSCRRRWVARVDVWGAAMAALLQAGCDRIELSELIRGTSG